MLSFQGTFSPASFLLQHDRCEPAKFNFPIFCANTRDASHQRFNRDLPHQALLIWFSRQISLWTDEPVRWNTCLLPYHLLALLPAFLLPRQSFVPCLPWKTLLGPAAFPPLPFRMCLTACVNIYNKLNLNNLIKYDKLQFWSSNMHLYKNNLNL